MPSDEVRPACWRNSTGEDWRVARQTDLGGNRLCSMCQFDAATVGDLDRPLAELVVARTATAEAIHLHAEHGQAKAPEPEQPAAIDAGLYRTLADPETGPEAVGLAPLSGGDD